MQSKKKKDKKEPNNKQPRDTIKLRAVKRGGQECLHAEAFVEKLSGKRICQC